MKQQTLGIHPPTWTFTGDINQWFWHAKKTLWNHCGVVENRSMSTTFNTIVTLWLFNIAMDNHHFNRYIIYKRVIFHSYVRLPAGSLAKNNYIVHFWLLLAVRSLRPAPHVDEKITPETSWNQCWVLRDPHSWWFSSHKMGISSWMYIPSNILFVGITLW